MQSALSPHLELSCLVGEVKYELENPVDPRYVAVIAFGRCKKLESFLSHWVQTAEAQYLVSHLAANFGNEQFTRTRLPMLLVICPIHRWIFGAGEATGEAPHLPVYLSRRGLYIFEEAAVTYAQHSGLKSTLHSLAP
jgi:hypothetical protein